MRRGVGIALLMSVGACIDAPTVVADDRPPAHEGEDELPPADEGEADEGEGPDTEDSEADSGGDSGGDSDADSGEDPTAGPPPDVPDPGPDPVDPTPFEDAAPELGLDVVHNPMGHYFATPGQAWADIDRDGFLDVVLTTQLEPNRVFMGGPGGSFSEPSWASDLALDDRINAGAVFADYDNDGWTDLYVLAMGPNALMRNLGGQGFEEVTQLAGVGEGGDGETASWGDLDGDGYPELYVVNNDVDSPDALYQNLGEGSFLDRSALLDPALISRPGFSASFFDYDLDGDLDLYVANDKRVGNVLWRNDGPGCGGWCMSDVSELSGADVKLCSMGVAVGDYDADGDQDLFVTSVGPMALLENEAAQGAPHFIERAVEAGVMIDDNGWGEVGWGAEFLDFDNDGWLDLYVGLGKEDPGPEQHNVLLRNLGDGTFAKLPEVGGAADGRLSWSVARADFDGDGWLDIGVANRGAPFALFRNRGAQLLPERHHLSVELRAAAHVPGVGREAIGARVELLDDSGHRQTRQLIAGSSLGAGSSLIAHFGLGEALPVQLRVYWPDGLIEEFSGESLPLDARLLITRE